MRRALLLGIDNYPESPLQGCVNDVERMASVLQNHFDGTPNFECRKLTAPLGYATNFITRSLLRESLQRLFGSTADVALFYFSGHGTENDLDGFLVTQDAKSYDEGVSMTDVLKFANDSSVKEVIILIDCCHSGHLGNPPVVDNSKALLREGVSIVTASRGEQPSVEVGGGGLFTSLVIDALEGGAADILGNVGAPAVYAFVEAALGAWDQRPLFKSHVSRVIDLRQCKPPIDRTTLRRLPELFPLPAEEITLDPSFEPQSNNPDAKNTTVFSELQNLARLNIVVPSGASHMYDAAMESKACSLTPSGRYYWRLAKENRI